MIRKLPDDVRHSLRSGFAVASVRQCVEELVLNSTDSGATCIAARVDLETLSVQVVDNGCGLREDDLDKVGIRYFTSKCHSLQDLDSLAYYGFRGEATASIADVSSVVEISSRWKDDPKTFTKLISNGKSGPVSEAAVNRPSSGTTVTVYNLFYNLPVRRKRIDPVLEFERVRQGVEALSLIQASISYSLKNDALRLMVLKLPKSKDTRFRFCQVYGLAHSQRLRVVGHAQDGFAMSGFISREGHYNTAMQHLYVNKRLVLKTRIHKLIDGMLRRESLICRSKASAQAGRLHATPELHAVFVIDIQCHWREYDVCFEPAKTLIEFRDWDALLRCVEEGVRSFLKREDVFLDLSKEDGGGELTEESRLNESERDLHHTKEPDKNVFETACERVTEKYSHANLTSKSVCRSKVKTNASPDSESPASAIQRDGEMALETQAQTHGENQSQCRTSECPPIPEDKKILVLAMPPRDSLEPFKGLYEKTRHGAGRSTARNGGMVTPSNEDSDNATVALQLCRCPAIHGNDSSVIVDSQMASHSRFPPLDIHGLESQEEENPKLKTSSCSGSGNSAGDFRAEREAATHGSAPNEWRCEPYRTSWHPPIPAKRKISLVTHRVDSLLRFKRPCGKTQHAASSSSVQNNQTTVHAGSQQKKTTPGFGDDDDMTETRQRILQSDFLQETPVPEDTDDPGGRLTTPCPLTLMDFANPDRNNPRPRSGLHSISAKLSKLKQNLKPDSPTETTRAGDLLETQTTELSRSATMPPTRGPCPQTSCEQHNVCTPEKPLLDPDPDPSNSPDSSDWTMVYDSSIGRNVFINRATGMSSYKGPQEENKALCRTDLTTMSIGLVHSDGFRSRCCPFLPEPPRQSDASRAPGADPELCSLWCDLSRWENPVFKRHPTVAVDVSTGHADTLAVKIHNILYPYRFTKDMVNSMKVLQQVDNKFIACLMKVKKEDRADPDGNLLVLVDQHAAHERVRLEQLIADSYETVPGGSAARQVKVSAVNPPFELDVTEEQHRLLRVFSSSLSRVGLSVLFPESDSRRVLVGTVPLCFVEKEASETQRGRSTVAKKIVEELLREQVEMFQTSRAAPGPVPLTVLKVLASQACHGAVKFNDSLTLAECRHLIQSLSRCNLPFQCAHGRPSILPLADISHLELEEQEPRKPNLRRLRVSRNDGP